MRNKIKALAVAALAVGAFTFTIGCLAPKAEAINRASDPALLGFMADAVKSLAVHPNDDGRLIVVVPELPIYCEADFDCTEKAAIFGCVEIVISGEGSFLCHGPTYRHQLSRHSA